MLAQEVLVASLCTEHRQVKSDKQVSVISVHPSCSNLEVCMNPIVYSPANRSNLGALMREPKRPKNRARRFRSARIAHELKNCMSMLILAVADLETRSSDPAAVFQSRREIFEKAVFEINTLVDELVQLVQEGTHKEPMSER